MTEALHLRVWELLSANELQQVYAESRRRHREIYPNRSNGLVIPEPTQSDTQERRSPMQCDLEKAAS